MTDAPKRDRLRVLVEVILESALFLIGVDEDLAVVEGFHLAKVLPVFPGLVFASRAAGLGVELLLQSPRLNRTSGRDRVVVAVGNQYRRLLRHARAACRCAGPAAGWLSGIQTCGARLAARFKPAALRVVNVLKRPFRGLSRTWRAASSTERPVPHARGKT